MFTDDWIGPTVPSVDIGAWIQWRRNGTLPRAGGWLDQPLWIIVRMLAMDRIWELWNEKDKDDFSWLGLTANDRRLMVEVERALG